MLHKTSNMLDEAERMLSPSDKDVESPKNQDSNLLDSIKKQEVAGQRELDSDEMDEEMMEEYPN